MSTSSRSTVCAGESDERAMLRDAAARYVERGYAPQEPLVSRERWREFAELGWLALGLPEACGGLGDAGDAAVVAEALGRVAASEPWLANVGLAAPLLAALRAQRDASTSACEALLGAIAAGEQRAAVAAWEPQGRYDASDVATQARRDGDGWRLDGVKTLVFGGGTADVLLVPARESDAGGAAGEARKPVPSRGLAVFAVPAGAPGLRCRTLPTYDGRDSADLRFEGLRLPAAACLSGSCDAWPAMETAIDHATALACIEAVGTMDAVLAATQAYLQQRRQFGRPLASNQVLRHRLVDLFVVVEQSRAISEAAVARLGEAPAVRRRAVSLAKAFVSPAARRCGEEGIQLHGAIGMTEELALGRLVKRLIGFANFLGDEAWHLERVAEARHDASTAAAFTT
ncbi:MAG: acyl-CoA dehydrogenase family protein [Burkholderiaceae bacterium]